MRVGTDEVLRNVAWAGRAVRQAMDGAGGLGRQSRTLLGATIVALSAGTVASMIATVVLGPVGDQVLARNGDANRGPSLRAEPGMMSARYDAAPAAAELPAPAWTEGDPWSRRPHVGQRRASRWAQGGERSHRWTSATARVAAAGTPAGHSSVCVRLCDGFFFPVGEVHGASDLDTQTAVCSNACPGAPTRLFVTPSGVSEMDEAVAVRDGKPYTALPVAYAHTSAVGPTCTCHAEGQGDAALTTPMRDITLRDGDSVMTAVGWRVFKGNGQWPYSRRNFSNVATATGLSGKTRSTLVALENATLGRVPPKATAAATLDIRVRRSDLGLKDADGHLMRMVGTETGLVR